MQSRDRTISIGLATVVYMIVHYSSLFQYLLIDLLLSLLQFQIPAYQPVNWDKCNQIMGNATGSIFSLFNIASAQEVPFGLPQHVKCILLGLTSVFLCVPFTIKSANLVLPCDYFLSVTEIICIFHSGYFDYRGAFQKVLDHTAVVRAEPS